MKQARFFSFFFHTNVTIQNERDFFSFDKVRLFEDSVARCEMMRREYKCLQLRRRCFNELEAYRFRRFSKGPIGDRLQMFVLGPSLLLQRLSLIPHRALLAPCHARKLAFSGNE